MKLWEAAAGAEAKLAEWITRASAELEVARLPRPAWPIVAGSITRAIAARVPEGSSTLAVRITGDEEMAALNRRYAGEPHATDVLSFSGSRGHLGDIAISWPAVVRQAEQYGHDDATEAALLSVHGLLHLLGWDHATAAERKEMTRLTVLALSRSRIKLTPKRL